MNLFYTFSGASEPAFFEALGDPDPGIRLIIATNALKFASDLDRTRQIYDAVAPLLEHGCQDYREKAKHLVWYLDKRLPAVQGAILKAMYDPDVRIRWLATVALSEAGSEAAFAILELLSQFDDIDHPINRGWTALCLGKIGARAALAIKRLEQGLDDHDQRVREESSTALRRIRMGIKKTYPPSEFSCVPNRTKLE